jgi:D-glycero-D-manno-heptose 1,7-bisphosphate phosphatase
MSSAERRAVFLDRDGTVIHDADYPKDPEQVRLLPGAAEALAELKRHGFRLIVISNQSGIGRGIVTPQQAEAVHRRVAAVLAEHGVELDAAYYCPHAPEERCSCRKPEPGMIRQAVEQFGLDVLRCYLVGDKPSDIEAGRRAGCRTVLLRGHPLAVDCQPGPDGAADDWPEVLRIILTRSEARA